MGLPDQVRGTLSLALFPGYPGKADWLPNCEFGQWLRHRRVSREGAGGCHSTNLLFGSTAVKSMIARLRIGGWFLLGMTCLPARAVTWGELLPTLRQRFAKVRQLSTAELSSWLEQTNRPAPILVDARAAAEFAVSHLSGAQRAETVDQVKALLPRTPPPPIVLYCSVGYRSSDLATKLLRAGVTNVYNLEGSIFTWVNEGRPVVRGTQRVREVHPYDEQWGQLLAPEYRAFKPRASQ